MKCKNLHSEVHIVDAGNFNGVYKTSNSINSNSYSYYRSAKKTDRYDTHFTIFPTERGEDVFVSFHISLNFSKTGVRNGNIHYEKGIYRGTSAKNLTENEKKEFEALMEKEQQTFDRIALQFWKKVQQTETDKTIAGKVAKENARRKYIQSIKKTVEDNLLAMEGVTAVDIDYKISQGVITHEMAIIVFVEKKRNVPKGRQIPKTIKGIKTDVWEGSFFPFQLVSEQEIAERTVSPQDDIADPIVGGVSVGPFDRDMYGTLGIVLTTEYGANMMISSAHVLASSPHTVQGDPISQPALPFGGHWPQSYAGSFFMGFLGQPYNVDAALTTIPTRNAVPKAIMTIGGTTGHDVTFPGDDVAKFGRTTQFTTGKVVSDTLTFTLNYPYFGQHTYYNQLRIQQLDSLDAFAEPGDSGAIVVNEDREVVGMVMGGGRTATGNHYTVANPIDDIIRTFEANGLRFH
ncbi:MAG: trypsin-like serine protease [Allomuricauda sp.]